MVQEKGNRLVFNGCNYFRQRLTLSILSGRAIEITDIRSKAEEPGLKGNVPLQFLKFRGRRSL